MTNSSSSIFSHTEYINLSLGENCSICDKPDWCQTLVGKESGHTEAHVCRRQEHWAKEPDIQIDGAGVLLLVTSVVLIGSSVLRRYVDPSQGVQDQDFLLVPEPLKVFATIGALAVYIVLFNSDIGFRWATFLFILSAGWILGVRRRRDVILLIALASMTAVGCHYLFTQVFVVDIA